jgi:tetratricopeptide (TPR) repeat protein
MPRITDFGLAKRDAGELTMTLDGQVLGTPAYMSPEQVRDPHAVDGRSDLYSLGVILYQLLTGELPFRGSARMLLLQVLCDEPRPPRQLNEQIPRDLETICLKCLRKDPARRYRTAAALAADLRRWLAGEPIEARPVRWVERLWQWLWLHPALALTGGLGTAVIVALLGTPAVIALIALAMAAGLCALYQAKRAGELAQAVQQLRQDQKRIAAALEMTLKQCYVARQDRDRAAEAAAVARRRFEAARELARTVLLALPDQLAELPDSAAARALLAQAALEYLDRLRAEAGDDQFLLRELAAAYSKIGDVQGHPHQDNIGDPAGALDSYRKSAALFEQLVEAEPSRALSQRDLAAAYHRLGLCAAELGAGGQQSDEQRLRYWVQARAHQQRAHEIIQALQQRGALADADAGVPDLLAAEISRCDAMIAQLARPVPV